MPEVCLTPSPSSERHSSGSHIICRYKQYNLHYGIASVHRERKDPESDEVVGSGGFLSLATWADTQCTETAPSGGCKEVLFLKDDLFS